MKDKSHKRYLARVLVPAALCIIVFYITYNFQTFTILRQEGLGLFINTPDFYRALFFDPLPISSLIGSFLVQFYTNHTVGALIFTGMVLLSYFLATGIVRRLAPKFEIVGIITACVFWWFSAHASSPTLGVAMLLALSAIMLVVAAFRKHCKYQQPRWWSIAASAAVIAISGVLIATDSKLREVEKWSKVEFAAVQGDWDYLLKTATPEAARKDPALTPYALLALNAQGKLTLENMAGYPVAPDFGLDYGEELSYRSCLFDAVLYSNLGCPNEAIHRTHQCGDFLYHGTSFRTLRMLVKENYALQDSLMVVKYCDILEKSLTHRKFVRHFKDTPCPQRAQDSPEERSKALLTVSKDQMETMLQISRTGINSGMAMERYYGYYQLKQYFAGRDKGRKE